MNRSLVILLGALALGVVMFGGSYFRRPARVPDDAFGDDLSWLQDEFHLSDAEMARIQKLHEGYLPKCAEMCAKIAAKNRSLKRRSTARRTSIRSPSKS